MIKQEFGKFPNIRLERSKVYKHLRGVLKLISLLKEITAVMEVNGKAYFHTILRLIPIFCISSIIKYLRYVSWCFEKMRKLPEEYPQIYKHSREEKFLVKTNIGYFKSGEPDKSKDFRN